MVKNNPVGKSILNLFTKNNAKSISSQTSNLPKLAQKIGSVGLATISVLSLTTTPVNVSEGTAIKDSKKLEIQQREVLAKEKKHS